MEKNHSLKPPFPSEHASSMLIDSSDPEIAHVGVPIFYVLEPVWAGPHGPHMGQPGVRTVN